MRSLLTGAVVFAAIAHIAATGHSTELVYKCANRYSQQPCPDGLAVDVDDPRSSADKKQAELRIRQDSKTAQTLEKERLQQEKKKPAKAALPPDSAPGWQDTGPQPSASSPQAGQARSAKAASKPQWFKANTPAAADSLPAGPPAKPPSKAKVKPKTNEKSKAGS